MPALPNLIGAQTLERSWSGPAKAAIRYRVELLPDVVRFAVEVDAPSQVEPKEAGFEFGLWRSDCVELFIASPEGRYVEFNAAPNGSWWSRVFESVRTPADVPTIPLEVVGSTRDDCWSVSCEVSVEALEFELGPASEWTGNLVVVVGGCDDDNPDEGNLHSVASLRSSIPDFHRPADFVPIRNLTG